MAEKAQGARREGGLSRRAAAQVAAEQVGAHAAGQRSAEERSGGARSGGQARSGSPPVAAPGPLASQPRTPPQPAPHLQEDGIQGAAQLLHGINFGLYLEQVARRGARILGHLVDRLDRKAAAAAAVGALAHHAKAARAQHRAQQVPAGGGWVGVGGGTGGGTREQAGVSGDVREEGGTEDGTRRGMRLWKAQRQSRQASGKVARWQGSGLRMSSQHGPPPSRPACLTCP